MNKYVKYQYLLIQRSLGNDSVCTALLTEKQTRIEIQKPLKNLK